MRIARRTLLLASSRLVVTGPASAADASSTGRAVPFSLGGFGIIGVFGLDWLLDPAFIRLLDNLAASPGAVRGVRAFGALSGGRDKIFPTVAAGVWDDPAQPPDFTRTLAALGALVSRRLTPFLPLTFFPPAVAATPITLPKRWDRWQLLVRRFLEAAAARFGTAEIARWHIEVWNEPNMLPFWAGNFDRYLDLYRATSQVVRASGLSIRLGGPALAYLPGEGPALMDRFLRFLRDEPGITCDFISYHRKGAWVATEGAPDLARLVTAADETATAILRHVPERAPSLTVINDEADMMVGFNRPFPPRMTAQSASWLAASMIAHDRLTLTYARYGLRFVAASDNANLQLAQAPFDGRRMLMTPLSPEPSDQVKLPVLGFYEMLRLLAERRVANASAPGGIDYLVTAGPNAVAALLTRYTAEGPAGFDLVLRDLPWSRINIVQFRIDAAHTHAGIGMADASAMRLAQELGVVAPPRRGLQAPVSLREHVELGPFATALVWITPFDPYIPPAPTWLEASRAGRNVVLRWSSAAEASFYSYDIRRTLDGATPITIGPDPLRAAMWIDTAAPAGPLRYAVRSVTASGVPSAFAWISLV